MKTIEAHVVIWYDRWGNWCLKRLISCVWSCCYWKWLELPWENWEVLIYTQLCPISASSMPPTLLRRKPNALKSKWLCRKFLNKTPPQVLTAGLRMANKPEGRHTEESPHQLGLGHWWSAGRCPQGTSHIQSFAHFLGAVSPYKCSNLCDPWTWNKQKCKPNILLFLWPTS